MAHPFTLVKETKSLTGFLAHNLTIELAYIKKSSRAGREGSRFFFSNLSIFEIEKCFITLFRSLGALVFTSKKI